MKSTKLTIFTDGGSRGNPGPGGIGAIAYDGNQKTVFTISKFLGHTTNNKAEYGAVVAALKKAEEIGAEVLDMYLDSELVVKQLNREYKVKDQDLAKLFLQIHNLTQNFKSIKYTHIRREKNIEADELANQAMDKGS